MGRGRGKGRKQIYCDDADSGKEEKIPASKRRRGPHKNDEDGETEMIDDDTENVKSSITNKDGIDQAAKEDVKRRKISTELKKDSDLAEDEKGSRAKSSTVTDDSVKFVGFRRPGSRRKGKPCRAPGVGVNFN